LETLNYEEHQSTRTEFRCILIKTAIIISPVSSHLATFICRFSLILH